MEEGRGGGSTLPTAPSRSGVPSRPPSQTCAAHTPRCQAHDPAGSTMPPRAVRHTTGMHAPMGGMPHPGTRSNHAPACSPPPVPEHAASPPAESTDVQSNCDWLYINLKSPGCCQHPLSTGIALETSLFGEKWWYCCSVGREQLQTVLGQ